MPADRAPLASSWTDRAFLVAMLPVGYVLSVGPLSWLHERGILDNGHGLFRMLYSPLLWLMQHNRMVADAVFAYLYYVWDIRIG